MGDTEISRALRVPSRLAPRLKRWLSRWQNMRLSVRMHLGFGVVLLLLVSITLAAMATMSAMDARMQHIVEKSFRRGELAAEMSLAVADASIAVRNLVIVTWVDELPAEMALLKKAMIRYDGAKKALAALIDAGAEDEAMRKQFDAVGEVEAEARKVMLQAADSAMNEKKEDAVMIVSLDLRMAQNAWVSEITKLTELESTRSAEEYAVSRTAVERSRLALAVGALLALITGGAFAWLISRSVVRPIATAVESARSVAQGDLRTDIHTDRTEETGQLLQALVQMQTSLRGVVRSVNVSTDSIAVASQEVASGSQDLSQRTESAASELQHAASRLQELSRSVDTSTQSASQACQLAASATASADATGKVMVEVVETMDEIQKSSRRVAEIVSLIDAIAFQTNILALNAAVEAARAGEGGRGFSVVAAEVRSLAQRCATAAKEIKELIDASTSRIDDGSKLVGIAGEKVRESVSWTEKAYVVTDEMSKTAHAQSEGLRSVSSSIARVDDVTQQNAALVEQLAAASESLREQAFRVAATMRVFKLPESERADPDDQERLGSAV